VVSVVRTMTMTMNIEIEVYHYSCCCSEQESGGRRQSGGGEVSLSGIGSGRRRERHLFPEAVDARAERDD
jgi:hypothetical protein